ncbi:MAG: leucine-rich repeat domain-containing protein [Clostridiales bacterium]|nr:leucine-rich repeat domain-containing protein [Clostridiales bacterium]
MLTRRFKRGQDAGVGKEKTVAQDGFSATIECPVLPVSPRPWHDDTTPFKPISEEMLREMACSDQRAAAQSMPAASAAAPRGAYRAPAGFATVGRHVLDFADNGDGTLTVARCIDPQADDLDIQFEAGACPVVAIAPKAFEGCAALRRVVLPPSLKQIGEKAFSGCARLMQLVIPGGVTRVGTLAFANCAGLERVRIEPGVQTLGPSCFSKCTSLVRVDVPSSLVSFGGGVFFGCGRQLCLYGAEGVPAQQYARLNGVAYDSQSWKEDELLVFEEQEDGSLVVTGPRQSAPERIEIPAEVCGRKIAAIAPKAFFACGTLYQLSLGANVRSIGESAFFGCRSLTVVSFERGLESVGDSAFAGCENLPQVTLPWGTTSIGHMAFFGCTRLSFVKMPPTTRVADFAFDGCAPNLRVFGGVSAGRIQETLRG